MSTAPPVSPHSAPSAGWFDGRTHHLPVRVYYEDTDFTGVVYHANYLRFFERGRSDFVRLIGLSHTDLMAEAKPAAFSVVKITVAYRRAARVDDALLVTTSFDTVSGARLAIGQSLWRGGEEVASASVEACCIDLTGRAIRPPASLLQQLKPLLAPT
jgi:acyl-CoA thioester hydrolase